MAVYAGYQEPIPTSYTVKNMKSAVPRLKKNDSNPGHVTGKRYTKAMLPTSQDQSYSVTRDHPWASTVYTMIRVMALYDEAIYDVTASILLEEAKTDE